CQLFSRTAHHSCLVSLGVTTWRSSSPVVPTGRCLLSDGHVWGHPSSITFQISSCSLQRRSPFGGGPGECCQGQWPTRGPRAASPACDPNGPPARPQASRGERKAGRAMRQQDPPELANG